MGCISSTPQKNNTVTYETSWKFQSDDVPIHECIRYLRNTQTYNYISQSITETCVIIATFSPQQMKIAKRQIKQLLLHKPNEEAYIMVNKWFSLSNVSDMYNNALSQGQIYRDNNDFDTYRRVATVFAYVVKNAKVTTSRA